MNATCAPGLSSFAFISEFCGPTGPGLGVLPPSPLSTLTKFAAVYTKFATAYTKCIRISPTALSPCRRAHGHHNEVLPARRPGHAHEDVRPACSLSRSHTNPLSLTDPTLSAEALQAVAEGAHDEYEYDDDNDDDG
jgi:hypothetical protein